MRQAFIFICIVYGCSSVATECTWKAGNGNWTAGGSWTVVTGPGTFPNAPGDIADFAQTNNGNSAVTLNANITVGTINFNPTIAGRLYTIGGSNTNTLTFQVPSGNAAINVLSSTLAPTVISSTVTSVLLNSPLVIAQDATSGTSSLAIAAPIARSTNDLTVSTSSAGPVILSGAISGNGNFIGSISGGGAITVSGAISGSGGVTKSGAGAGSLTLSGSNNTFTGVTTVNAGTLALNSAGTAIPGDVTVAGGTLLALAANQISETSAMTLSGGSYTMGGFAETIDSLTFSSGALTQGGATLTLAGSSTALSLANGVSITGNIALTGSGDVVVTGATSTPSISGALNIGSSSHNFNIASGSKLAISGNIQNSGSAGVTMVTGTGTMVWTGTNPSYSGTTTLSAGTLQVGDGTTTGQLGSGNVINNSALLFKPAASSSYVVSNIISGNGTVTIDGNSSGTIQFSGASANTYTGLTTVSAGTMQLNKTAGVGAFAGDVTISGGTLTSLASNQIADTSTVTLSSGTFNHSADTIGTFIYTGGTFNQGATLNLASSSTALSMANAVSVTGNITLTGSGAVVVTGGSSTPSISGAILDLGSNSHTVAVASGSSLEISSSVQGAGGLTTTGAGTLEFSGTSANTYTGLTTVSAGTLQLNKAAGVSAIVGDVTITGGTLDLSASDQIAHSSTVTVSGGALNLASSTKIGTLVFNSGTFTSTTLGAALTLMPQSSISNPGIALQIRNKTLTLADDLIISGGNGIIVFDPANNGTASLVGGINLSGNTVTFNIQDGAGSVEMVCSGVISNGSVTKTNTGLLQFSGSGANTYAGLTTVSGGILSLSKTGVIAVQGDVSIANGTLSTVTIGQIASTSTVTMTGGQFNPAAGDTIGTFIFQGGVYTPGGTLTLQNGGTALSMRGNTSITGPITIGSGAGKIAFDATNNATATISSALNLGGSTIQFDIANGTATYDMAVAGVISNGSITKTGAGTLLLTGTNTYSATAISGGTLQVGDGTTTGQLGSGNVINTSALVFQPAAGGTTTVAGNISGSGGTLTHQGASNTTVVLNGSNSYTGVTTINAGTLQIGNGAATGQFTGAGSIVNNGTLLVKPASGGASTIDRLISGGGALTQQGADSTSVAILTAANTYTGLTTITSGTLQMGNNGTVGTLGSGNVTNNSVLSFKRLDSTYIVSNTISGTGSVAQDGAGTTTLTGSNSYGVTAINAGTLQIGNSGTTGTLGNGDVAFANNAAWFSSAQIATQSIIPLADLVGSQSIVRVVPSNLAGLFQILILGSPPFQRGRCS